MGSEVEDRYHMELAERYEALAERESSVDTCPSAESGMWACFLHALDLHELSAVSWRHYALARALQV